MKTTVVMRALYQYYNFQMRLLFGLIGCKMMKTQTQIHSEELMENQPMMEVTSDDKLWALLAYVFTPLVPIIIMLMEDKKNRPFIRTHNGQALVVGIVNVILSIALGWTLILSCVPLLVWFACVYWGIQAYGGKMVEIPIISNFVRNQGWA